MEAGVIAVLSRRGMMRKILKMIHAAYSGVEACLKLARDYVYWPGITAQVKEQSL